jgi:hypothetical protein
MKVRIQSNFILGDIRRQAGDEFEVSEHQLSAMQNIGVRYEVLSDSNSQHDARHNAKPPVVEK